MNPTALSMFISALGLGTTITLSSHHWLLAWAGLEINTLAIIPLMASMHHPRAIEATTKYFLTQAAAAALILFASIYNAWVSGEWATIASMNFISTSLLSIALTMNLGLAPFHFWMPDVLQGLTLNTGLILSTWQKLAPISLLFMISPNLNTPLIFTLATLSTLVGGWGGLNQTQLRKIMAYSSIAHLGWMTITLTTQPKLTIFALAIYLISTSLMFLTFNHVSATKNSTLATSWIKNPFLASLTPLSLLSLGGLPPLSGFMPKWFILTELTKQNTIIIATVMTLSSLLSLYFYLRLSYSLALTISPNFLNSSSLWRMKTNLTPFIPLTLILSSLLLPISPSLINLF
uniref:NADH-ubiquinone oxidoreductase chain 2 n=1 Tax=Megophrys sp. FH-2015 TaxID=1747826 RepID=A0A0S1S2U3_9ANUR|nr:NADH dehydrogenase subunit 2 [Megophrys sp. FH-2015]